jgi:hypothetical protein
MEKTISAEDLKTIRDYKLNVLTHNFQVEKAVLENQIAELQLQNVMLRLYVKYGLDDSYTIDYDSGEIVRKDIPFVVEPINLSEEEKRQAHQEILEASILKGSKSIREEGDRNALDALEEIDYKMGCECEEG